MLKGDNRGAVNCLAQHPFQPILGTSGLSHTAKLWTPNGDHAPLVAGSAALAAAQVRVYLAPYLASYVTHI